MQNILKTPAPKETSAAAWWPAVLMLAFSMLATGWLHYRPARADAPMLSVFSPFIGAKAAWTAAVASGGKIVGKSPLPFALIVQSDDPDFAARIRQAGAWLLLDATGRGLCSDPIDPRGTP